MTLKDNLQEIYSSAETDVKLVSNWACTRLYQENTGWGRLWRWIYNIVEFIGFKEFREKKLSNTLLLTHKTFLKKQEEIVNNVHTFQEYIAGNVPDNSIQNIRHAITQWNETTQPFQQCLKEKGNQVTKLFNKAFPKHANVFPFENSKALKQCQQIIDIEGILQEPIPFDIISDVAQGKKLKRPDEKIFDTWLTAITKNIDTIGINLLHKSLKIITQNTSKLSYEMFNRINELKIPKNPFLMDDPKQMKWRRNLKPGQVVFCQETAYTLESELFTGMEKKGRYRVFNLQNDPNNVMVIARNHSMLSIRQQQMDEYNSIIEPVPFTMIDPSGRCGLMKKMSISLKDYQWKVDAYNGPSEKEKLFLNGLALMIQAMIENHVTPEHLSASKILLDSEGNPYSKKILISEKFSYTTLEDFIFDVANENSSVLNNLMIKSTFKDHRFGKFFQEVVHKTIDKEELNIKNLSGIYECDDHRVVDRALLLAANINEIRIKCCRSFRNSGDTSVTKEQIKSEIKGLYDRSFARGKLIPNFYDILIELLTQ